MRGNAISMIFQEPMTSLNPVFTCGDQIAEAVALHLHVDRKSAMDRAVEMLGFVGIPDARRRAKEYPHQLSGGMRQRVMIAMALSTNPALLIADEPTTALDVTIQAQILELMKEMRTRNGMAIMLITHDLGVVAEMAHDVVVMYAGKIVEQADAETVFERPHHPYTQGLLASIPRLGERRTRLEVIKGTVPNPLNLPKGCLFKRRCPYAMPICDTAPPFQQVAPGHLSRCWLTPTGEPPAVGAAAPPEVAEAEAARLSVEAIDAPAVGAQPRTGGVMTDRRECPPRPRRSTPPRVPMEPAAPRPATVSSRKDGKTDTLVEVKDLVKHFEIYGGLIGVRQIGAVQAVDGVSFDVRRGETLGLVGESGCGKTTLGKVILRLDPADLGHGDDQRPLDLRAEQQGDGRGPARHADRLPGSVRQPQPAHDGRRDHRRGALTSMGSRTSASGRTWSASSWAASASTRATSTAIRTSSPAASGSASASRGRSPSTPSSSCATSRYPRSTSRSRARS